MRTFCGRFGADYCRTIASNTSGLNRLQVEFGTLVQNMIDHSFPIVFRVLDSTSGGILAVIFPSIIVKSGETEHNGSADGTGIQNLSD